MSITMYDSIVVSTVPRNPQAVAGYVGGYWPDYSALVATFPHAHHLSIAVNAGEDAECLDVEAGDASPSQAPSWVLRQMRRGVVRPVVYANASTMPLVTSALSRAGIKRNQYRVWLAHYTYRRPSEPFEQGADAVQYSDRALGRNLDVSACVDSFFGRPKPPPVVNKMHYERFEVGPFKTKLGIKLNERNIVVHYDGARQHPKKYFLYLKVLRAQLKFLANRIAYEAGHDKKGKSRKPVWNEYNRGWRYQQLIHRAQGQRFA